MSDLLVSEQSLRELRWHLEGEDQYLRIRTLRGSVSWVVTVNGSLYDEHSDSFRSRRSGDRKFLGLVHYRDRRIFIPFEQIVEDTPPKLFDKNGQPLYVVREIKHGKVFEWGGVRIYGVHTLEFVK